MPDGRALGLRPSTPADDGAQIGWVASAEEVERFAGPSLTFPVRPEQLQAHRDDPAIATFVTFVVPGEPTPVGGSTSSGSATPAPARAASPAC